MNTKTGASRSAGACVFCGALGETHTKSSGFKDLSKRIDSLFPVRDKIDAKRDVHRDGGRGFTTLSSAPELLSDWPSND